MKCSIRLLTSNDNIAGKSPAVVAWFAKASVFHSVNLAFFCERWIKSHRVWWINRSEGGNPLLQFPMQNAGRLWPFILKSSFRIVKQKSPKRLKKLWCKNFVKLTSSFTSIFCTSILYIKTWNPNFIFFLKSIGSIERSLMLLEKSSHKAWIDRDINGWM